jgi:alkanesulfonate monooxygenase SsuD/methylene tetrahydromethanopterin reductase-like flavin-dependent oxidoreductase (luciferase family)
MKIGIGLPNQVRGTQPTVIPAWAAQAEQAGFSTLGTVGRIAYPGIMDTVALAAAAGATQSIGLFSNILLAPVWPAALLAKETAGIDEISGGRLTLGIGAGIRDDDFVVDGFGPRDRGRRFDRDLEIYRDVWNGEHLEGSPNPAVTEYARPIPLIFGGQSKPAFGRMARWGIGYVGGAAPASMVTESFDAARAAWKAAGREGEPRLVAIAYFAVADGEQGRQNVYDYYSIGGDELASFISGAMSAGAEQIRTTVQSFADIGADELILNPAVGDLSEISRLADIVL